AGGCPRLGTRLRAPGTWLAARSDPEGPGSPNYSPFAAGTSSWFSPNRGMVDVRCSFATGPFAPRGFHAAARSKADRASARPPLAFGGAAMLNSLRPYHPTPLLALAAVLTCFVATPAFAGPKPDTYWQVDDVRAGMKGFGRTVMKGTKV